VKEYTIAPNSDNQGTHRRPTNIIFIHGLGGSARGTWTHEATEWYWPESLPDVNGLENVRVMAFGYNADWNQIWKANNVLDISDFGGQLRHTLFLHFSETGEV
jgi:hypothetical protein